MSRSRSPQHDTAPSNTTLAVVIPCYNAGEKLRPVVEGALCVTEHVVVVDDGSTDGGVDAIRDLPARIETQPENRGKGEALIMGFRTALNEPAIDCVAVVDADGQHDTAELSALYEGFRSQKADLLIGMRTFGQQNVPWASWFGNRCTAALSALLLRCRIPDTQSGFRLHSRRFLEDIIAHIPGGRYETEMAILIRAVRGGYTIASLPIRTLYDPGNASSHFRKVRDSWRVWRVLFSTLRAQRGGR
ncbi:MAG: glycosyltransferase [Nitrospiraceae bacterium]|nr:glycosyltransferase [Nitrospiraceae bacterium]